MIDWEQLETTIRRDPGGRGLASFRDESGRPLLAGHLQRAAMHLAEHGRRALVVTGFCIVTENGATAETDGPLGAIYLAAMLAAAGIETKIATDAIGAPIVRAGLQAAALPENLVVEFSYSSNDTAARIAVAAWRDELLAATNKGYSHLIAVERVGPNHTVESLRNESRDIVDEFERMVPPADRDTCRNMRGVCIDQHTAPLQALFERPEPIADADLPHTIGIVDGGNEIGCGLVPWNVLRRAVANGGLIACRIATDDTIAAGISNWGAYALGAAVAALRRDTDAVEQWTAAKEERILRAIVEQGGAVDGVTKRAQPTVDGLPADAYLRTFDEIRAACGGATAN